MSNNRFLALSAALIATGGLVLSACSSSSTPGTSSTPNSPSTAAAASAPASAAPSRPTASAPATSAAASPAPASAAPAGADLKVGTTKLGPVVVDAKGFTVYYFKPDVAGSGKSACTGACLAAWPAVVASGAAPSAIGVTGKLGVITRDDGTKQVTVDGRPVYTFANDKAPGQVNGQSIKDVWFAVSPSGAQVGGAASGSATTTTSAAAVLKTGTTKLGTVIVDANGRTVYFFTPDVADSGKSACTGACLAAWPAVVAPSVAPTATGVTAKLGVITRSDGVKQVTVDGRPVYTFSGDKAAGDANGQHVKDAWYVVSPSGQQIVQ